MLSRPTLRVRFRRRWGRAALLVVAAAAVAGGVAGCEGAASGPTPPISPGTPAAPREINIVARDYSFSPPVLDLVPGETVAIRFVNGGLEVHEAVIGGLDVQDAWERAEAATVGHPPGPTPVVSLPPEVGGLRIVARSGERVDATWTVPADAGIDGDWYVGCHIPGHWDKGMVVPVRFVRTEGQPVDAAAE